MTIEGVDYAWTRPKPAELYAAGKRFACRYVSNSTTTYGGVTKNLSLTEAKALSAAGVAVVANWEWSAGDARKGYTAGQSYAKAALSDATAAGMPAGRPIYFSVDFDPSTSDWSAISEYFRGIRSVLGLARTGIYGGRAAIQHAKANGWASWFWQTYAWSGGIWVPDVHIQQYKNGVNFNGSDLDLNRAMVSDYGQWKVGVPIEEEDLVTTQAEFNTFMLGALSNEDIAFRLRGVGWQYVGGGIPTGYSTLKVLNTILTTVLQLAGQDAVDENALAAALAAQLDSLTPEELAAIATAAREGAAGSAEAIVAGVLAGLPEDQELTKADVAAALRSELANGLVVKPVEQPAV